MYFANFILCAETTGDHQKQGTHRAGSEAFQFNQYWYDKITTTKDHQNRHSQDGFDHHQS